MAKEQIPEWVTYPEGDWNTLTPEEAGLDVDRLKDFLADSDVRGGYLVHAWGDKDYKFQTASVGKAFTWALVGLAVNHGLIRPDDLIHETWTGEGQLSHPHKYLNQGHHKWLTWSHLTGDKDGYGHLGGFPVTNGY